MPNLACNLAHNPPHIERDMHLVENMPITTQLQMHMQQANKCAA